MESFNGHHYDGNITGGYAKHNRLDDFYGDEEDCEDEDDDTEEAAA